jgi:DNA-binding Lrp family transcriptional regulator
VSLNPKGNPKRGVKRERILRVLANNPDGGMSIRGISKETDTSRAWIKKLMLQLEDKGLIEGTRVLSFSGLVEYWRTVSVRPKRRSYTIKDGIDVIRKASLGYALTTYMAENLIQGYLFRSRIDLYILPQDQGEWHAYLSKRGLVGRGNVRTLALDEHVFYNRNKHKNLTTVSIPQLIVDLLKEGGPCTEAAELLMNKMKNDVLRYTNHEIS